MKICDEDENCKVKSPLTYTQLLLEESKCGCHQINEKDEKARGASAMKRFTELLDRLR